MINNTLKSIILITLTQVLTGCAGVYSSKFSCPSAGGYGCTPIDVVYQRIISGQIEEVNAQRQQKSCKSRSCRLKKEREMKPRFKELSPAVVEFVGK